VTQVALGGQRYFRSQIKGPSLYACHFTRKQPAVALPAGLQAGGKRIAEASESVASGSISREKGARRPRKIATLGDEA
jgi:hypothetical protein